MSIVDVNDNVCLEITFLHYLSSLSTFYHRPVVAAGYCRYLQVFVVCDPLKSFAYTGYGHTQCWTILTTVCSAYTQNSHTSSLLICLHIMDRFQLWKEFFFLPSFQFLAHLVYQPKGLIQSCFCPSCVPVGVDTSPSHRLKHRKAFTHLNSSRHWYLPELDMFCHMKD